MPRSLQDALLTAVEVLERHKVRYAITGSFALAYHGVVRATADVDVKVAAAAFEQGKASIEAGFRAEGFVPIDDTSFRFDDRFDVELHPARDGLDREAMHRRLKAELLVGNPKRFWLVTAEDLVLIKLREYERTLDYKHVDDARKLVAARPEALDRAYLEERIIRHRLGPAWQRAASPG